MGSGGYRQESEGVCKEVREEGVKMGAGGMLTPEVAGRRGAGGSKKPG